MDTSLSTILNLNPRKDIATIGYFNNYPVVDYYMMKNLDSITKAVAKEKDALFVDLASHAGWMDSDFYDFSHMTPHGAEKVGVFLYDALKNMLKFAEQDSWDNAQGCVAQTFLSLGV